MKPFAVAVVALSLAAVTATSQPEPVRVYTRPRTPSREALDRLNLTLAWSTRLATDGARDGLFSVQFMPDPGGLRLVVQTLGGVVVVLDAETGDTLWRTQVGTPYWPAQPVAFDSQHLFAVRRQRVFVLDRDSGQQLLWDVDRDSKERLWGALVEDVPSAGLAADEDHLYIVMGSRVSAYRVPNFRKLVQAAAREGLDKEARRQPSHQLTREWTQILAPHRFLQPPRLTPDILGLIATDGTLAMLTTLEGIDRYRYQVEKKVRSLAAQHGSMIYVGSEDSHLYAFDLRGFRLWWRFPSGGVILRPVHATDRDVYVSPERIGMCQVDRTTGRARWVSRDAQTFLATNYKFVYALDRFGRLLVLDDARGTTLAQYDVRDWPFLVPNEQTDRLYLAAHDGSLVCLHHRNNLVPVPVTTPPSKEKPSPKGPKEGGGKKEDGKKDGGMKDDGKKVPAEIGAAPGALIPFADNDWLKRVVGRPAAPGGRREALLDRRLLASGPPSGSAGGLR